MSDNDSLLASTSVDCVKIWNGENGTSIKTIHQQNIVSCIFLPLNKHVLLGSKQGKLFLIQIASNECIQEIGDAHKKEIWGLDVHLAPKKENSEITIVSCSADTTIKFWNLVVEND